MRYLRLVIDANIVFAALVRNSITRKLIIEAPVYYYSPAMIAEEIREKIALIYVSFERPLPLELDLDKAAQYSRICPYTTNPVLSPRYTLDH